jgi:hypothetical protein
VQRQREDAGTEIDQDYLVRDYASEVYCGSQVAEAILELAGVFPMSDEVAEKFAKRGIDITQRLALVEMEDDDEPQEDDEDEGEDIEGEALAKVEAIAEAAIAAARRPRKSNNI